MKVYELVDCSKAAFGRNEKKIYSIKETYLNPDYIIRTELCEKTTEQFKKDKNLFPEGLDEKQKFTKIIIHSGNRIRDVIAIGNEETIFSSKKTLLKG